MSEIEIIPAIDLRGGRCVRLYKGDFSQETFFSDDPINVALKWQSLGAPRLHIVDLDGARSGQPANYEVIKNIAQAVSVPIQVGGGIRQLSRVEKLLKSEVDRVILGTSAVENPEMVVEAIKKYGTSIAVGIDTRDGYLSTCGWQQDTDHKALDFAQSIIKLGVKRLIYTDINRDGTLTEPNFSAIFELINSVKVPVVASGGVTTLDHLKMLRRLGAEGAIIGKALYTQDINLKQVIEKLS